MFGNINMKLGQLMILMNWMILWICGVAGKDKWLRMIFYAENVEPMQGISLKVLFLLNILFQSSLPI